MKIAFIMLPFDPFIYPYGMGYYIVKNLKEEGCEITLVGGKTDPWKLFFKAKTFFYRYILKKSYARGRDPYVLKKCAKVAMKELENLDYDLIFSIGALPISYFKSDKPIVFISDATFAGMTNFYDNFSHYTKHFVDINNEYERLSFNNSKYIFLSSNWAKKSAVDFYSFDPNKIVVVPLGANIDTNRKIEDINLIISKKRRDKCVLLFVGVDWSRKGAETAIEITKLLNENYFPTELHIVGTYPPKNFKVPDNVYIHGFLSKASENSRKKIDNLFIDAHFFVMPTKAEAFGQVFCEANSFGVPSISTNVGGVPDAIIDGKNGKTFELGSPIKEYCDFIDEYFNDWEKYTKLSISSFEEYQTRLNWKSSVKTIKQYLDKIVTI